MRLVMFDTETTGRSAAEGDRIVEIGCVELIGFEPGETFHRYLNPERDVPEEVVRVHGLTGQFLADKPRFSDPAVVDALLAFFGNDTIVAHNAAFDRSFLNAELERIGRPPLPEERFIDTYALAGQKLRAGARRSLDALAKYFQLDRLGFDLTGRKSAGGHGALLDAKMLAEVYIGLMGGREQTLAFMQNGEGGGGAHESAATHAWPRLPPRPSPAPVLLTAEELAAHAAFLESLGAPAKWALWGASEAA